MVSLCLPMSANAPCKARSDRLDAPPSLASTPGDERTWVALVSGLSVGAQEAPADLKVQLLVEWLTGESGDVSVSLPSKGSISNRLTRS